MVSVVTPWGHCKEDPEGGWLGQTKLACCSSQMLLGQLLGGRGLRGCLGGLGDSGGGLEGVLVAELICILASS